MRMGSSSTYLIKSQPSNFLNENEWPRFDQICHAHVGHVHDRNSHLIKLYISSMWSSFMYVYKLHVRLTNRDKNIIKITFVDHEMTF